MFDMSMTVNYVGKMAGYTKLFNQILDSTIWQESNETRILWITMMAMADRNGEIMASIPGLAKRAGITIEDTVTGLEILMSPDPYSRTSDYEGRRIKEIDGGWQMLNHAKYKAKLSLEERREYNRQKQAEWRKSKRQKVSNDVNDMSMTVNHNKQCQDTTEYREQKPDPSLPPDPQGGNMFKSPTQKQVEEVYSHYPRKQGRKAALAKIAAAIKRHGHDTILKATIAYAKAREGMEQQYTPIPATWYGQERYLDDPSTWAISSRKKTWKDLEREADHDADTEF
jgi:hypothetical protein